MHEATSVALGTAAHAGLAISGVSSTTSIVVMVVLVLTTGRSPVIAILPIVVVAAWAIVG